jgi:hypothetical protein
MLSGCSLFLEDFGVFGACFEPRLSSLLMVALSESAGFFVSLDVDAFDLFEFAGKVPHAFINDLRQVSDSILGVPSWFKYVLK